MNVSQQLRRHIEQFAFCEAFTGPLGWNRSTRPPVTRIVSGRCLTYTPLAEMGGFVVLEVTEPEPPESAEGLTAPRSRALRTSVGQAIAGEMHDHVLVFLDADRHESVWHLTGAVRGKQVVRERRYYPGAPAEPLVKLLRGFHIPWSLLDDSGEVAHTKMVDIFGASGALAEKVTKKFYTQFEKQRKAFEPFLAWIDDQRQRAWYITALLNRLMFIYFIQHRGLLRGDTAYLRHRLMESQARGADLFYREFFLPLCFFGFGKKQGERDRFQARFDGLPYLDGGLFLLHDVEKDAGISPEVVLNGTVPARAIIPDAEFARWFDFFDAWDWTLDETHAENDRQIDPAILGHIFEKYINQKQMGAYYTKEDITGYICRNTIIPRLFDMLAATGDKGRTAVDPLPIGPQPNLLNGGRGISQGEGIDRYIYDAVKTIDRLPTETDREYDARQKRYQELLQAFDDGEIRTVNDFITFNLDIVQMATDFVRTIQDAEVLRALYFECLRRITVLDPTCGSGAFLFAALKILAPLYEACLDRMDAMLSAGSAGARAGDFRAELDRIREHANRDYYILKTIIVSNLYGVDIMEEAVEICKLRLFLQLVGHADPDPAKDNLGIEPLPDIDFNIRCGNTLVGYVSIGAIDHLWQSLELKGGQTAMTYEKDHTRLRALVAEVGTLLRMFRDGQLGLPTARCVTKADVIAGIAACGLHVELNKDLRRLYREAGKIGERVTQEWFDDTHTPLHWFLEFPDAMAHGGFDVVAGNPPYVNRGDVAKEYRMVGYRTAVCPDIYAACMERSTQILNEKGRFSMIVPISFQFSNDFATARNVMLGRFGDLHASTFSRNPAALFSAGLGVRNTIVIASPPASSATTTVKTTRLMRWIEECRPSLFHLLTYAVVPPELLAFGWPRTGRAPIAALLASLVARGGRLGQSAERGGRARMGFKTTALYYVSAFADDPPAYSLSREPTAHTKIGSVMFPTEEERDIAVALALGKLALLWWASTGDDFDVTAQGLLSTPVGRAALSSEVTSLLADLSMQIRKTLKDNVIYTKYAGKMMGNYDIKCVRYLTDEVDALVLGDLGLEEYTHELELFYTEFMKQTGERPGTTRAFDDAFDLSD